MMFIDVYFNFFFLEGSLSDQSWLCSEIEVMTDRKFLFKTKRWRRNRIHQLSASSYSLWTCWNHFALKCFHIYFVILYYPHVLTP